MWKHSSDQVRTAIAVPMILYTSEQILVGQGMIWWFKRWVKSEEEKAKESDHMGADSGGAVAV
jgi:predicted Na+-dependent transporter